MSRFYMACRARYCPAGSLAGSWLPADDGVLEAVGERQLASMMLIELPIVVNAAACSRTSGASLLPILGCMGGRDYIQVVRWAHTIATICYYGMGCSGHGEGWRGALAARGGECVMAAGQV